MVVVLPAPFGSQVAEDRADLHLEVDPVKHRCACRTAWSVRWCVRQRSRCSYRLASPLPDRCVPRGARAPEPSEAGARGPRRSADARSVAPVPRSSRRNPTRTRIWGQDRPGGHRRGPPDRCPRSRRPGSSARARATQLGLEPDGAQGLARAQSGQLVVGRGGDQQAPAHPRSRAAARDADAQQPTPPAWSRGAGGLLLVSRDGEVVESLAGPAVGDRDQGTPRAPSLASSVSRAAGPTSRSSDRDRSGGSL